MPDNFQIEPKNGTLSHEALTSEIWGKTIFTFLSPEIQIPIAQPVLVESDPFKSLLTAKLVQILDLELKTLHFFFQNWNKLRIMLEKLQEPFYRDSVRRRTRKKN